MSKNIILALVGLGLAFTASASTITSKSNAEISALAKNYASQSNILADAQTNSSCYGHFKGANAMLNDVPSTIEQYGRDLARDEVNGASMYVHAAVLEKCNRLNEIEVLDRNLKLLHSSF